MRIALLILLLAALCLALALQRGAVALPEEWNPWAPLRIEATPNLLTRHKLGRLSEDPGRCMQVLATAQVEYQGLPDRQTGPACGMRDAVRIERTSAEVGAAFSLTCRAAVSLALWERHSLQPAALRAFGAAVARIEHFGSYACRNIYNRSDARRSRHATAEAFDVAGFVLTDGRRIRVLKDWPQNGAEARFLHEVRTGACAFFDGVLSPDYNAAHRDHLHLDRGPYRICR